MQYIDEWTLGCLIFSTHNAVEEEEEAAEKDGDRNQSQNPIIRNCTFHIV